MAKVNLPDIGSLANTTSARQAINDNFSNVESALDNTLSRDGSLPNHMEADIDMNSNDLLNVNRIDASEFYREGVPFEQSVTYGNKLYETFDGGSTEYTMAIDPGSLGNLFVSVDGVVQTPGVDYNYSGTTLSFVLAPAAGVDNVLVRYDQAVPTGVTSSLAVSYLPPGTGGVSRTLQDKAREFVTAEDYGALGDGSSSDDTPLLNAANAAVAAGRKLVLNGTKTYAVGTQVSFPAGLKLVTNGAVFHDVNGTAGNSPLLLFAANTEFDILNITVPTGVLRQRAVVLTGNNIQAGPISITYTDQQTTDDNNDASVRIVSASNSRFGRISVVNHDRPVLSDGCSNTTVDGLDISSYVRGFYTNNCTNFKIGRSYLRTASPNASYTAGHVGALISGSSTDSSRNVTLEDWTVEDAGEHGFRVGGPEQQSNIYLVRPRTKNCGGSGIKILGTDSGTPTARNKRIYITDPVIEDCGVGELTSNMCGILAMYCDGLYITNPTIRKQSKLQSGHTGIRLVNVSDVHITEPDVGDATFDGIWVDGSLGDINRLSITGGITRNNGRDGFRVTTGGVATFRRFNIDGLAADTNTGIGCNIAIGAGGVTDSLFRMKLHSNTGGAAGCDNAAITLHMNGAQGATSLSGITAAEGSTWKDNLLYTRQGAKWIGNGRVLLGAAVVNNNAVADTMQDVTGLALSVESGKTYRFKFYIPYSAAAATTGSRWSITGPTTSFLQYRSEYTLSVTSRTVNDGLGGAYDAPAAANASSASTAARNVAVVEGIIIPNAAGTLQARFASEVAGSAITAASTAYLEYEEVI